MVFAGIRRDNEPVLTSSEFEYNLERFNIHSGSSIPYVPWTNSHAERCVQSLKSALRTTMLHCDPRLWDYALKQIVETWNLMPRWNKKTNQTVPP